MRKRIDVATIASVVSSISISDNRKPDMQNTTFARRAAVGLTTLAMIAAVSTSGGATPPRTDGPFNVLEWADGVTTSRSGYAVWVSLRSSHHRVQIPGYTREVGPPEHGAALRVACRTRGGDLPERFPPTGPQGGIYLENHPEDPGVYTVLHPMYWILGLSGHDEERWPVQVRIGERTPGCRRDAQRLRQAERLNTPIRSISGATGHPPRTSRSRSRNARSKPSRDR